MIVLDLQPNPTKKHIEFFKDSDMDVQFESTLLGPVIHCYLSHWNKDVLFKCYLVFEEICNEFKNRGIDNIFALVKSEDDKHKKFVSLFGFDYYTDVITVENEPYEFWSMNVTEYLEDCEQ